MDMAMYTPPAYTVLCAVLKFSGRECAEPCFQSLTATEEVVEDEEKGSRRGCTT